MNQHYGTYVFVDSYQKSILLAYHKLFPLYFVLLYRESTANVFYVPFESILNTVPIFAIPLHIKLDLHGSINRTMRIWREQFLEYLLIDHLSSI